MGMGSTLLTPDAPRRRLRYQRTTDDWHTWYALRALGQALDAQGTEAVPDRQTRTTRRIAHVVSRLHLMRNLHRSGEGPVFVAMMGYAELRTLPFCYWTRSFLTRSTAGRRTMKRWTAYFRRHRIRLAFFSARGSGSVLPRNDCRRCTPCAPGGGGRRGVLQRPAAHGQVHGRARAGAKARRVSRRHRGRPRRRGQDAPLRAVVRLDHLRDARRVRRRVRGQRISICFPRSMTHTAAIGGLETVTHRYFLSSLASGCLVGHCPEELRDLFGYNPVIEVEPGPGG